MVQAVLEKRRRLCCSRSSTLPTKASYPLSSLLLRMESGDISLISAHAPVSAHASPHRPSTASSAALSGIAGAPSIADTAAGCSDADVDKYVSEYRILSVRQRVLENELMDIQTQIAQVMYKIPMTFGQYFKICICTG
jgi:hypothetical protein